MKIFHIIFLSIFTILPGQSAWPFQIGERLTYNVSFTGITAGQASLEVVNDTVVNNYHQLHIRFNARTTFPVSSIYTINDQVDTWLDSKYLYTKKLTKNIREGNYKNDSYTIIDYDQSIAITNGDTVIIDQFLRDSYSLFYFLRTIPLIIGETIDFTAFDGKIITPFQVITKTKETINTMAGTFPCLVVKPFREGTTLLKNKGDMMIWFSDDKIRLPIQIRIKLKYGSMLLKLKDINL
ncbi:MAG: DUF3108 domain-containing protein [Candidatus Marinimicrobia bacterium]|jgi:hypothetical protein|nr:DUF3108 domain-containing protein [Candidatus Neomarinimicrobiota bacterium]